MPSKSKKQARFMRAVAHSPEFAKKAGVPQSVGREFVAHDKRVGKYAEGGRVKQLRRLSEWMTLQRQNTGSSGGRPRKNPLDGTVYGKNTPSYLESIRGWDPKLTDDELMRLEYQLFDSRKPRDPVIQEMVERHGIPGEDLYIPLYRGMQGVDIEGPYSDSAMSYFTANRRAAQGFSREGLHPESAIEDLGRETLVVVPPTKVTGKVLPNPLGGESEFIAPMRSTLTPIEIKKRRNAYKYPDIRDIIAELDTGKYADGGTVKGRAGAMLRLSRWIKERKMAIKGEMEGHPYEYGTYGENTLPYLKSIDGWDPIMPSRDFDMMEAWADAHFNPELDREIAALTKKYGIPMKDVLKTSGEDELRRGIGTRQGRPRIWGEHSTLKPQSVTLDHNEAQIFYDEAENFGLQPMMMRFETPYKGDPLILPIPNAGQSEFVMPQGTILQTRPSSKYSDSYREPTFNEYFIDVLGQDRSKWAEGGHVADGEMNEYESFIRNTDQRLSDQVEQGPTDDGEANLARYLLRGFGQTWSTPDEEGGIRPSLRGFVDQAASIPALLGPVTDAIARPFGHRGMNVAGAFGPSLERAGATEKRMEHLARAPHNALFDAVGIMGSQLPIPYVGGGVPKKGMARVLETLPEFLFPTIRPTPDNYASGIAGGAALMSIPEEEEEMNSTGFAPIVQPRGVAPKRRSYDMRKLREIEEDLALQDRERWERAALLQHEGRLKKAGGGRVTRLTDLIKAVREMPNVKGRRIVETNEFRVAPRNMPKDREEAAAYYDSVSPDSLEDILHTARTMNEHFMVGPRLKKAGGGRIGATANSINAIKQALSHIGEGDRTGAVRVLSSADPTPEIRRVIDMLRSPQSPSASRTLRETLASTDPEHNKLTPFLADGGQAKPHNPANDYEPGLNRAANIRDGFPPQMTRAEREDLERRFGPLPPPTPPRQVAKKAGGGRVGATSAALDKLSQFLGRNSDPARLEARVPPGVTPPAVDPATINRARATLMQETPVDLRAARGYTSAPDPRAALSPVQDASPMRAIGDRMALIESVVQSMPAGPARDTLVDEYSGLRRQLAKSSGR